MSLTPVRLPLSVPAATYNENGRTHSSIHAERLDQIGTALSKPGLTWLRGFSRICLLDLKPGWWGQHNSLGKECTYRACIAIACLVTAPFALLISLLSLSMVAVSNQWKKDFVFQKADSCPVASKTDKIAITSFNTMLMPEFITLRNKHRPTSERAHEIAAALLQQNSDFICLQESFDEAAADVLSEALHKRGYHIIKDIGPRTAGMNSGLLLASKYELDNVKFFKFPIAVSMDAVANKGVLIATAKVGNKKIVIANTHLHGGGNDALYGYIARASQSLVCTQQIQKYIQEMIKNGEHIDGVFLAGDTNISPVNEDGTIDSEWLISGRLNALDIQFEETLEVDPKEVQKFKAAVQAIRKEVDQVAESVIKSREGDKIVFKTDELSRLLREGGAFPSTQYTHELHNIVDTDVIRGTVVNMDAHRAVAWGGRVVTKRERVDFIEVFRPKDSLNRSVREPVRDGQVVTEEMLNANGQLSSDHLAVTSTYTI